MQPEGSWSSSAGSNHLAALDVTARVQGSTTSLSVSGQVDVASAAVLAGEIRAALTPQTETLVLDLTAVDFFSAAGLATLFDADKHACAVGSRLVVVPGSGAVQQMLEHTDAHDRLTLAS